MIRVTQELVRQWLPERKADGHKGDFGRVLAVCGAVGYTGAPVFASRAAVRSGAGLVFLAVPQEIYAITAVKSDEAMPFPLPGREGKLSESALEILASGLDRYDAVLAGCGLGQSREVQQVVLGLMQRTKAPLVLDADGINSLSGHIDALDARRGYVTVLTPHEGEFARLGETVLPTREEAARRFAGTHGCILVLKGHRTLTALPDGTVYENTTGNCGMAKGGSGDLLAGMILALLGQGMEPGKAAAAAVWLHGRAGDLAAEQYTPYAMTPTDLLNQLGAAFGEVV